MVSIRPTTGIKPLYTTIAAVTVNPIVTVAICFIKPKFFCLNSFSIFKKAASLCTMQPQTILLSINKFAV